MNLLVSQDLRVERIFTSSTKSFYLALVISFFFLLDVQQRGSLG